MTAETQPIRRRGRPPVVQAAAPPVQPQEGGATPRERRRPRASVGGFKLKLDAPQREGFVRRFVNADPSRVMAMEELGYTAVNDRAADGEARTDGLGSRISRHAGKFENGSPMQAILMETPVEEHNYGLSDKEEARKPFEEAIRRSADMTGQVEGAYKPNTESTLSRSG